MRVPEVSSLVLSRIIREETSRLRAADVHKREETSRSLAKPSRRDLRRSGLSAPSRELGVGLFFLPSTLTNLTIELL
jgi:hypothetical protein